MKYLDLLFSLIAPHHCLSCQQEGSVCCQKCLEEIHDPLAGKICYRCQNKSSATNPGICKLCLSEQSLDSVNWYANYKNQMASNLVKSLKFNNIYASAQVISMAISSLIPQPSQNNKIWIVPAPTAGMRARTRGWDQAKLITKSLAKSKKLPYRSLLVRTSSFDQIGSTKKERSEASKRFFEGHRKALIKDSIIILVDDVITTGSTLNSAAEVLKSAGAKEVHGLVFARQGLRNR